MKCNGKFKFKELTKKEAGEFKNSNGEIIKYDERYALKVDEITENGIYERIFKIAVNNQIIEQLQGLKPYQDIVIEFEVQFYNTSIRVIPVALK